MIFNTLAIASMAIVAFMGVCIASKLIDDFVTSDRYIKALTQTYKDSRDQALKQVAELTKQNAILAARLDDAEKACKELRKPQRDPWVWLGDEDPTDEDIERMEKLDAMGIMVDVGQDLDDGEDS